MILAGDIGGTKTVLAIFEIEDGKLVLRAEQTFESRRAPGLEAIAQEFLAGVAGRPARACFGIAGPVVDGRVTATNLPWSIDARRIQRALDLDSVDLRNDLEAAAFGIQHLIPEDLAVLNRGVKRPGGNIALIAAGTGLGQAFLVRTDGQWMACPSEGGHADFAPRNEVEIELFRHLARNFGRVSWERVLSGPGLWNIYEFLRATHFADEPDWLKQELVDGDRNATIAEVAMRGTSDLCRKALDMFAGFYGAQAGNLALTALATGGVYVGGGIAPKILGKLIDGTFYAAFVDKGRLRNLMEEIPVHVIRNRRAPLLGAAALAAGL